MMSKRRVLISFCALVFLAASFFAGFYAGGAYQKVHSRQEVAFYATIKAMDGSTLSVEGIPENDVNHRGNFVCSITDLDTPGMIRNVSGDLIEIGTLQPGTEISILYDGYQQTVSPVILPHVYEITVVG